MKLTLHRISAKSGSVLEDVTVEDPITFRWDEDTFIYEHLPKYDTEGYAYTYSVTEEAIDNYETTQDGNNFTNRIIGETELGGTKTWVDIDLTHDNAQEITLELHRISAKDGSTIEDVTVEDPMTLTWTGNEYKYEHLPKYDAEGYA